MIMDNILTISIIVVLVNTLLLINWERITDKFIGFYVAMSIVLLEIAILIAFIIYNVSFFLTNAIINKIII